MPWSVKVGHARNIFLTESALRKFPRSISARPGAPCPGPRPSPAQSPPGPTLSAQFTDFSGIYEPGAAPRCVCPGSRAIAHSRQQAAVCYLQPRLLFCNHNRRYYTVASLGGPPTADPDARPLHLPHVPTPRPTRGRGVHFSPRSTYPPTRLTAFSPRL
jgi:hypothetical protein